jgi:DNA repair protein RadC
MHAGDDILLLAILDRDGRADGILPLHRDWRSAIRRLIRDESSAIALLQRRPSAASAQPRPADIALTRMVHRRLRPLGIRLADHVIFSADARFSFREAGLL